MKATIFLIVFVFFSMPVFADDGEQYVRDLSEKRLGMIESNLKTSLDNDSPYVLASASQVISDLKRLRPEQSFSELIIPLMAIVKNKNIRQGARISAARALHDLQSAKGDFAIKRVALFTEDSLIRHVTAWLTYERMTQR